MRKCLLWGTGYCFEHYLTYVKYYELLNQFKVVGVTARDLIYSEVDGYKGIDREELGNFEFDIVIIMADGKACKEIRSEVLGLGIMPENVFSYRVLLLPDFNFEKYLELRRNPPSIFACNCWGGLTYYSLDLEFTSPLINTFCGARDYLCLLKEPQKYMSEELEIFTWRYNKSMQCDVIVAQCGDIQITFPHDSSFEEAKEKWERRKKRINWNNILVMMYTENRDIAEEFVQLPYEKKICFVPFQTDDKVLRYVEFNKYVKEIVFANVVNKIATREFRLYNPIDLALEGRFKKVCEYKQ